MLVKTVHRNYPKLLLRKDGLSERGKWNSANGANGEIENVKTLPRLFKDLKEKQFISSCSTSVNGEPRKTKHNGDIERPQVAEWFLKMAAGIDIHNQIRTGSAGLEHVWLTNFFRFIITNAYLANSYIGNFENENPFKIKLANQLATLLESSDQLSVHRLLPLDSNV